MKLALKLMPAALAVAGAFATQAQAQEATPAAASTAQEASDAKERMETVTVSARRREERLQDVPLAVTAFSAKALERANIQNLADLQERVPNLTVYASRGTNTTLTAFIRGVGQADPVWGVDPGVGIYFDDVYMARPQGALLDVFDVQRIEVLRGPQGTLYGKNTIGGAIKYISRPLAKENGASAEVGIGNYNQRNFKAAFNLANESGTWRARLAAAKLDRDGFGRNTFNGEQVSDQDSTAARLSVGYFPQDIPLTVVLSLDATDDKSGVRGFQRMGVSAFDPLKRPASTDAYDIQSGMPGNNFTHNRGGSLVANYTLSNEWSVKVIGAKRRSTSEQTIDFDGLPQPIADVFGDSRDEQKSLELQASYSGDYGAGVIGLYRFEGTAGGGIYNNFLGRQFTAAVSTVETDSTALYTDWTWPLGKVWSINAGLRHTREEKRAIVLNRAFADVGFTRPIQTAADFDKSLSVSNTSPKISVRYEASKTTNFYSNLSRGFKSGGYNVRANNLVVPDSARPYKDEKLDALEVGMKYAAPDDTFDANVALFYNRYKDIQLSVFTSYVQPGGVPGFYGDFTNAGKATVKGAEFEFSWRPNRQWEVNGFLALLDANYDEFISGGKNIADTQKFSNTPARQVGLNVTRTDRDVFGGALRSMVGYGYRSKVYPTTDLSETLAQGGYSIWTAGVVWEAPKNWTFSLHASNLGNKRYRTDGYNIPAVFILDGFYGPPRQIIAKAGYKF